MSQEGPQQSKPITIQHDQQRGEGCYSYTRDDLLELRHSPLSQSWPFPFSKENIPDGLKSVLGKQEQNQDGHSTLGFKNK